MNYKEIYAVLTWPLTDETGAPDALLHVHAGMAIFLITAIVTRRPLTHPLPFLAVLIAALLNETIDRVHHGSWRWLGTTVDLANTLLWPLLLMVGLRLQRRLERRRTSSGLTNGGAGIDS